MSRCAFLPLEWAVIGAASRGRATYQPEPRWVSNLLDVLDSQNIPAFFKGNLEWEPWRETFPTTGGHNEEAVLI